MNSSNSRISPFLDIEDIRTLVLCTVKGVLIDGPLLRYSRAKRFHVVVSVPVQDRNTCAITVSKVLEVSFEKGDGPLDLITDISHWEDGSVHHIANSKNQLGVSRRHDGRAAAMPHQLFAEGDTDRGDTIYWGGYEEDNVRVDCSGDDPLLDRHVSQVIVTGILALGALAFQEAKYDGLLESGFVSGML